MQQKFLHEGFRLLEHARRGLLRWRAFYSTDQNILRRMGKIDKFQQLRFIAAALQQVGTDCIRHQRSGAFLDDPVSRQDGKLFALYLPIQFMLAAGHG